MQDEFERRKGKNLFARRRSYRICTQCVMDTSDPEIAFDEAGVCNHCHDRDRRVAQEVFPGKEGQRKQAEFVRRIKHDGRKLAYDCVIGLSGGVDSTYIAYKVKRLGLRPLAVHLDNGWNSEVAVRNIESVVKTLDIDLYTEVLEWEEFRNLQLAFLRASTPDSEIPTDHAIMATLYRVAIKHGVRWLIDGTNVATEAMLPVTWSKGHSDFGYMRAINDAYSPTPLKTFPHFTYWDQMLRFPRKRLQQLPLLNYLDFDKPQAMEILQRELGWQPYGGKHYESIYTRFFQGYILPTKFGFDKRRAHQSCLLRAGNVTREAALAELELPALPPQLVRDDRAFVTKKLGISEDEFEAIMGAELRTFWDYPSYERDLPSSFRHALYWRLQDMREVGYAGKAKHSADLLRFSVLHGVARTSRVFLGRRRRRQRSLPPVPARPRCSDSAPLEDRVDPTAERPGESRSVPQ
jgi:N-acetyl sugar amidotransferase